MKQPIIYFDNYMLRDVELKDAKDMFEHGKDLRKSEVFVGDHASDDRSMVQPKNFLKRA